MDPEYLKTLPALGVGGILAVMFYFQNNKNARDYANDSAKQAKDYADKIETVLNVERGRTEMLFALVRENTAQTAANTKVVEAFHRRLNGEHREGREHGSS